MTLASPIALTPDPLTDIRDGILRGVAHALSNRVAALSGVAGLVDFGNLPPNRLSQALGSEVSQLGQLVEMLRLLPSDVRPRGEAIELRTLLPAVVALHADLRDVACTVQDDRNAQPVHLGRSVFVHAVLLLVDVAKRDALRGRGSVSLSYRGDSTWVTVAVESLGGVTLPTGGGSADEERELRRGLAAAVAQLDPSLIVDVKPRSERPGNGLRLELRLPTLLEVRRRERETAGESQPSDVR